MSSWKLAGKCRRKSHNDGELGSVLLLGEDVLTILLKPFVDGDLDVLRHRFLTILLLLFRRALLTRSLLPLLNHYEPSELRLCVHRPVSKSNFLGDCRQIINFHTSVGGAKQTRCFRASRHLVSFR